MNLIIVLELLCDVYKTFPYVQSFSFLSRFNYCTRTTLWCIQDFSIGSVFFFPLFKRESGDQVETQGLTTERIQPKFNCIVIDVNNLKSISWLALLFHTIKPTQIYYKGSIWFKPKHTFNAETLFFTIQSHTRPYHYSIFRRQTHHHPSYIVTTETHTHTHT